VIRGHGERSRPLRAPLLPANHGWRWKRHGFFTRAAAPHRIQRYRCGDCGHTFSRQSFSNDYWLRRPDVLAAAAFRLLACSGYRQIAREARCHHTTVMRHSSRLGRLALLYLWAHRPTGPLPEPARRLARGVGAMTKGALVGAPS